MPKPKLKTTETNSSVSAFIAAIPDSVKRADSLKIIEMMQEVSGFEAKMWGPSIIGFGSYHYKYASSHEGDAPLIGFSPRKAAISLYLSCDLEKRADALTRFGKYKAGKGCIYFKKLADINTEVLKEMIQNSLRKHSL